LFGFAVYWYHTVYLKHHFIIIIIIIIILFVHKNAAFNDVPKVFIQALGRDCRDHSDYFDCVGI